MHDMYGDSNEGMLFKLIILVGQGCKNEPLESPPRLGLFLQNFWFKFDIAWCVLWPLVQEEVLNLLHIYVVVLIIGTYNPCKRIYLLHIPLCLSIT